MQVTWYGHAAFRFEIEGAVVLVDPFFTGNPAFQGSVEAASRGATHIVLTHGHGDHVGDTVALADKTGAVVVANYELCMWLAKQGVQRLEAMNTGGRLDFGPFAVTLVRADHSSGMVEADVGFPLGSANGVILDAKGQGPRVYHLGDTDMFSDMALICEVHEPGVALVPIGDRFTMGPRTAAIAVQRFLAKTVSTVIPCHYGSFPPLVPDAEAFRQALQGVPVEVLVPAVGEAVDLTA